MTAGSPARMEPALYAAAIVLGAATLASKLLGLVRDRLLAASFGAGRELDLYFAAFQLPDALFSLILLGAASAAVLPAILERERAGRGETDRFVSNLLLGVAVLGSASAVTAIMAAPHVVTLLTPGFSPAEQAEVTRLTRIMAPGAVLLGLAAVLSAFLQARGRFLAFALPPVVYNLGIIGGIMLGVPRFGLAGLAAGVLGGGIMQIAVQLPTLVATGYRFRFVPAGVGAALGRVAAVSAPRVLATAIGQGTQLILVALLSLLAAGSISAFRFGLNLAYLPVSLFGVSWALAAFPSITASALAGRGQAFAETFAAGLRGALFFALPSAALVLALSHEAVRLVLGAGAFGPADAFLVASVLAALAPAIVSESVLPIVLRAFYALGRTREPLIGNVLSAAATVALAVLATRWFPERPVLGIALAFSAGSALNVFLLWMALGGAARRALGVVPAWGGLAIPAMAAAALAAAAVAEVVGRALPSASPSALALSFIAAAVAAGVAYAALLWWWESRELVAVARVLRRRVGAWMRPGAVDELGAERRT